MDTNHINLKWKKAPEYSFYRYTPHLSPRIVEITKPGEEDKIEQLKDYFYENASVYNNWIKITNEENKKHENYGWLNFGHQEINNKDHIHKAGLMVAPASNVKEKDMIEYEPTVKKELVKDLFSIDSNNIIDCFEFIEKHGLLGTMLNWHQLFLKNFKKNHKLSDYFVLPRILKLSSKKKQNIKTTLIDGEEYFKTCLVTDPQKTESDPAWAKTSYKKYNLADKFRHWSVYGEILAGNLTLKREENKEEKITIYCPGFPFDFNVKDEGIGSLPYQQFPNFVRKIQHIHTNPKKYSTESFLPMDFELRPEVKNIGKENILMSFPQTLADYCALRAETLVKCKICHKYIEKTNSPNGFICKNDYEKFRVRRSDQTKSFMKHLEKENLNLHDKWPKRDSKNYTITYLHPAERIEEWPAFKEVKQMIIGENIKIKMSKEEHKIAKNWAKKIKPKKSSTEDDFLKNMIIHKYETRWTMDD